MGQTLHFVQGLAYVPVSLSRAALVSPSLEGSQSLVDHLFVMGVFQDTVF